MRGEVRQGLTAHVHELSDSGKWRKVWHVQNYDGPDRWLLGQFDLGAGNFDIVFMAYDSGVATMDDISLLDGKCQDQGKSGVGCCCLLLLLFVACCLFVCCRCCCLLLLIVVVCVVVVIVCC